MIRYLMFRLLTVLLPFTAYYVTDRFALLVGNMIFLSKNWRINAIDSNLRTAGAEDFNPKNTFVNMIINYIDFIKLFYMRKRDLIKITQNTCAMPDEQFMLLTAHFGNWELGGLYITSIGYRGVTIAEGEGPGERMYKLFEKMRSSASMEVLRLEDHAVSLKLNSSIEAGKIPILLIDRDITHNGISVMFGNKPALVPKGPYFFSKRYKLPIYVGVFYRMNNERFRYGCDMTLVNSVGKIRDDAQLSINALVEKIKARPEEWFAFDMNWEADNDK